MAARPRSLRKRHWPKGLYERGGYYSWRNPLAKGDEPEELGIGRVPLSEAIAQAMEANLHVEGILKKPRLVDRLSGDGERTVDALILLHDGDDEDLYSGKLGEKLKAKELAENTVKTLRSCGRAVKAAWTGRTLPSIDTSDVDELLERWKAADQKRMALAVRSYLAGYFFRFAEAKGWIPRGSNPALITDKFRAHVKRARLSLEAFQTIYAAAGSLDPWVRHSMALAIVSARRREDIAIAEFKQRPDSLVYVADRKLYVNQQKVEHNEQPVRVRLPLELELKALGWSLEWAIAQCRDNIVSRWLIHHQRPRTKSKPGDQVFIDTITKGFRRARDRTSLKCAGPARAQRSGYHRNLQGQQRDRMDRREDRLKLPMKDGKFDVPPDVARLIEKGTITPAKIAEGAVTTAKITDLALSDPEFAAECGRMAKQMRRMLELQEDYFARRPLLRLARWLRLLPDPYYPARLWALREAGMATNPTVAAEIEKVQRLGL